MLKPVYFIVFLLLGSFFLSGCTRDDLCPAETLTTPNLVVTFRDFEAQHKRKSVEGLSVETMEPENIRILNGVTTDSIVLPLNSNSDRTGYRFTRTVISGNDTIRDIEEVRFAYQTKEIYLNRACGYRAEFYDLNAVKEQTIGTPWIRELEIITDSIVDETHAHITIFH